MTTTSPATATKPTKPRVKRLTFAPFSGPRDALRILGALLWLPFAVGTVALVLLCVLLALSTTEPFSDGSGDPAGPFAIAAVVAGPLLAWMLVAAAVAVISTLRGSPLFERRLGDWGWDEAGFVARLCVLIALPGIAYAAVIRNLWYRGKKLLVIMGFASVFGVAVSAPRSGGNQYGTWYKSTGNGPFVAVFLFVPMVFISIIFTMLVLGLASLPLVAAWTLANVDGATILAPLHWLMAPLTYEVNPADTVQSRAAERLGHDQEATALGGLISLFLYMWVPRLFAWACEGGPAERESFRSWLGIPFTFPAGPKVDY